MSKKLTSNPNNPEIPLLYKLLRIIFICFIVFCFLLLCLYIMGNFQSFQDKSQEIILKVLSYSAMFTALLAIPLLVENILMIISQKNKLHYILLLLLLMAGIIFCFICISLSNILIHLAKGI